MTCDERQDLLLAYALDANALEAGERDDLRAHLASGCPQCAGALAEAEALLGQLSLALDQTVPSPAVKERLMAKVAATESDRQADGSLPASFPRLAASEVDSGETSAVGVWFRMFVAAAVAACIAVMVTHYVVTQANGPLQKQVVSLRKQLDDRNIQVLALQTQIDVVNQGPTLKRVDLESTDTPQLNVFTDSRTGDWYFVASKLKPLPAGKTYEAWFITTDQKKIAAGTFDPDAKGNATIRVALPKDIGAVALTALTDEPTGGVAQPTGSIQAKASIQ